MLKIRWSRDRIIFNMGITYLGKTVLILRRGPDRMSGGYISASENKVVICSDNGLLPVRRRAIIWTSVDLLWLSPERTYIKDLSFEIQKF